MTTEGKEPEMATAEERLAWLDRVDVESPLCPRKISPGVWCVGEERFAKLGLAIDHAIRLETTEPA